jgi:hypothetical protein
VIALPRHLGPWSPHLALFPEDIALALGPLVIQLSQLIGSARIDHGSDGTPDGYDGIDRRGSYDRLLASEWLIHDELPDEFLRRVVSGEHAFLRRLHRHEAAGRRTVALFDSGIDQLGSPRIAHLAALIVLAQRAERARASLAWGILQEPCGALRSSVTMDTVSALLESHGADGEPDADVARWLASEGVAGASEVWLIGAEHLAGEPRRHPASVLAVSDVLEPDARQRIKVTASGSPGLRPRTVTLDVPGDRAAIQLLRDPFGRAVASRHRAPARLDVRSGMVFSIDGRKLYLRTADGGLLTVQIPNSPRAVVGPPVVFRPPAGNVIAVGSQANKRTVAVFELAGIAVVHVLNRRGRNAGMIKSHVGMAGTNDGRLRPLAILAGPYRPGGPPPDGGRLCFVNGSQQFVEIAGGGLSLKAGSSSYASRATRDAFVHIEVYAGQSHQYPIVRVARASQNGELEHTKIDLPPLPDDARYYFGAGDLANLIAYSPAKSRCTIIHRTQTLTFDVPRSDTVVGMVEYRTTGQGQAVNQPFAVAIDENRTGIVLLHQNERRPLLTAAAPIASAAVSDVASVIAFITEAGELGVYSCYNEAMVLRLAAETTP